MKRIFQLAASLTAVALLAGCVSSQSGDVYSRGQVMQAETVRTGTIVALRPVTIQGTQSPIGAGAGAVVGGIGGSAIGGGRGSFVTAIIGAVAGGLLGAATEEGFTKANGVEITVKEDDGSTRAYVQAVSKGEMFRVGERVRILTVDGTSRVAPN